MRPPELAPIALFVYNRPEMLNKVLDAIKENAEAKDTTIIVFSDGPKNNEDIVKVNEVRNVVGGISWCKELKIRNSEKNQGLTKSILNGVSDLLKEYNSVIVLEDDLLVSSGFLKYMNDALKMYKDNTDVISVCGYVYPVDAKLPETFFMRGADCLGWGTWKRGWDLLETDAKKVLDSLVSAKLTHEFNFKGNYPYTNMLWDQIKMQNYSWAILWHASAFVKNKLTLYPCLSLVNHIGINGTNYLSDPFLDKVNMTDIIHVKAIKVVDNKLARKIIVRFFAKRKKYLNRNKKQSIFQKIKSHFN